MIARAISIYIPIGIINRLKVEENIPMSWQHLLSWGSLRGALAVMLVYLIPGPGQAGYDELIKYQESI